MVTDIHTVPTDTPTIPTCKVYMTSIITHLVWCVTNYLPRHTGVFLHVLADTLGSVGVIISSLLVQTFGWHVVDPICSVFIAVLIIISVIPLLRQSAELLVLATPNYEQLYPILDKVEYTEGVKQTHVV